jgi:sigma54-dependent transcription regulator
MGVSTADDLKKKLPQLQNDLKNPEEFKKMYKFVYDFARDKSFKNLQAEVALDLWELLL